MVLKVFLGNSKVTLLSWLSSFLRELPQVAEEKNCYIEMTDIKILPKFSQRYDLRKMCVLKF